MKATINTLGLALVFAVGTFSVGGFAMEETEKSVAKLACAHAYNDCQKGVPTSGSILDMMKVNREEAKRMMDEKEHKLKQCDDAHKACLAKIK